MQIAPLDDPTKRQGEALTTHREKLRRHRRRRACALRRQPWLLGPCPRLRGQQGNPCQVQAGPSLQTQSSRNCTKNRRNITPRLSSLRRQTLRIVPVIELRRENQKVNAWMPNGRSAQTARQGNMGARAGAPGAIGRSGRCRQTSAGRTQTSAIFCPPAEAGASARAPSIGQAPKRCFWLIYLVDDPSTTRRIVSRLPW